MNTALNDLDDVRIAQIKPLIPPQILMEDYPTSNLCTRTVSTARSSIEAVVSGKDDRLLVVIGPCSIHDPIAAVEYGKKLLNCAKELEGELVVVMRVYFEKPRTTVGWKGLINDPHMDGSFKINQGLRIARKLLLDLNELGLPAGCEFLDTITPQYLADLVSWGAIGARTTESQVHRELASGLSVPVGFKNGTEGGVKIAIDAIKAASQSHHFLSVTKQGLSAIVATKGNKNCHVILRGGATGPNYQAEKIAPVLQALAKENLTPTVMVDCSHGNSEKQHLKQISVAENIAEQIEQGSRAICGVMIESHLFEGRQDIPINVKDLSYGVSVTDACIGWEDSEKVLRRLSQAVIKRRRLLSCQ